MDEARKPDRAAIAIAVFLLVVAAVTAWDASVLQLAPTYGLGPKMMAYVVAAGMAIIGVANLVLAWRGDLPGAAAQLERAAQLAPADASVQRDLDSVQRALAEQVTGPRPGAS